MDPTYTRPTIFFLAWAAVIAMPLLLWFPTRPVAVICWLWGMASYTYDLVFTDSTASNWCLYQSILSVAVIWHTYALASKPLGTLFSTQSR